MSDIQGKDILDTSKLQDYARCPRYFYYRHVLGWRPDVANNHLAFGAAFHEALANLYLKGFDAAAVVEAKDLFDTYYENEIPPMIWDAFHPKTPVVAHRAIERYAEVWREDLKKFELKGVEISGVVGVTPSTVLHFRLDTVLQNDRGVYFVLEHKTGTYFSDAWANSWQLSMQIGTYTHVLRALYDSLGEVVVNGIFFSKAKDPKIDFHRVRVALNYDQLSVWHATVDDLITRINYDHSLLDEEISKGYDLQLSFQLNPTSCLKFNRLCEWHDFCLAWKAPFQHAFDAPPGFKIDFWDPSENDKEGNTVSLRWVKNSHILRS